MVGLSNIKTYLVGSIQDVLDPNKSRNKVDAKLTEWGLTVLNPCKLETNMTLADTIEEQRDKLHFFKRTGKWEQFDEIMDQIIDADLSCVSQSTFVTVFWDNSKRHGGTIEEVLAAIAQSKPLYIICGDPISEWNDWILRRLRRANAKFFPNNKQYLDYVEKEFVSKERL